MIKLGIGCAQIVGDAGLGCGSSSGGITGGNTNIYAGGAAAAAGLLRVTAGTADIGGRVGLLAGNGQLSRGGVLHLSAATGETVSGPIGISSGRSAIGSTGALNIKTRKYQDTIDADARIWSSALQSSGCQRHDRHNPHQFW